MNTFKIIETPGEISKHKARALVGICLDFYRKQEAGTADQESSAVPIPATNQKDGMHHV